MLLYIHDIKREVWFGGGINNVNCRRLLKHHNEIINRIRLIFIEISKGIISDGGINLITNKCRTLFREIDKECHCIRSLYIKDNVTCQTTFILKNLMIL